MNSFSYYNPVRIRFGNGTIEELGRVPAGRSYLLVTTPGFVRRGTVAKIRGLAPQVTRVVAEISPNPDFRELRAVYDSLDHDEFEMIVALGGGSVIDSAKVFSVWHEPASFDRVEELIRKKSSRRDYRLKPLVAVPTTAGTGSEVTPWATVWDGKEKKKYSLHLEDLWAESCICDPELTLSLPWELTWHTALDALSHSLEAVWNRNANPVSTLLAVRAAREIINTLPGLAAEPENLEKRGRVMLAALQAGLAFSNTQTAVAHAVSYYLTAVKGIPHGPACSFLLPEIAEAVGGVDRRVDEALAAVFGPAPGAALREFYARLGLDGVDYGLTNGDLKKIRESLGATGRAGNSLVPVDKLFALWEKRLTGKLKS